MKKIYTSEELGSVYWLEGEALMFSPLPKRGIIDFEIDGSQVDLELMEGERTEKGTLITDLYVTIREALSK